MGKSRLDQLVSMSYSICRQCRRDALVDVKYILRISRYPAFVDAALEVQAVNQAVIEPLRCCSVSCALSKCRRNLPHKRWRFGDSRDGVWSNDLISRHKC